MNILIGTWKIIGKHPYAPDDELLGTVAFEWIEGGAFLKMSTTIDHPQFPDGIALFGTDSESKNIQMLYFDERKVSRIQRVSFKDNVLKWWRDDPKFSQRFTITFSKDGNTMTGKGEMRRDNNEWEADLSLNYSRIK